MFEVTIAEQIREAWIRAGLSRNHPEMVKAVPETKDLKALLEVAFLASIEKEEAAPVVARLVFFPDATTDNFQQLTPWIDALSFGNEIPLSPENLAKFAPAFDQNLSALAVARRLGDSYVLLGALFYGRTINQLESGQGSKGRPNALTLNIRAPGSVIVAFGDSVIGRLERGQFILADPGPMASRFFTDHIIKTISHHDAHREYKMDYWYLYRDCLERLYSTASREGHGSTIIWCPTDRLPDISARIQSGTQITTRQSGRELALTVLMHCRYTRDPKYSCFYPVIADETRMLAEYIDLLAHLACVDGALIIDDEISPHQFRCHIAAPRWKGRVLEGTVRNIIPTQELDISRFGTRHNSAIALVGDCPGVVAFVVSEDGPVRVMMRIEDDVVVWPDCLNTVFLD